MSHSPGNLTTKKLFDHVIQLLTNQAKLTAFDPKKKTVLVTDTSKLNGAASSLFQEEDNGKLTLIGCYSRQLRPNEVNWSATEIEFLALTYGLKKFRYYLSGIKEFTHLTDHQALVSLVRMDIDKIPTQRLTNLRLACSDYNFRTRYVPGSKGIHALIDQLSRNPASGPEEDELLTLCHQNSLLNPGPDNPDPQLEMLIKKAKECAQYQEMVDFFNSDRRYKDLPEDHPSRHLSKQVTENMSLEHGLLVHHDKILVPQNARLDILAILHSSHRGTEAMIKDARKYYFWPNMNIEIADKVKSCIHCLENSPANQQQPLQQTLGTYPGSYMSLDPFPTTGSKKTFLAIADSFSGLFGCMLCQTQKQPL